MKAWSYPIIIGSLFIALGILIFLYPAIVAYVIALVCLAVGVALGFLGVVMYQDEKKVEKLLEESEKSQSPPRFG